MLHRAVKSNGKEMFTYPFGLVAFLFLLGTAQLIVLIPRYQRIERGHFAAALGDRRLLADRQPQSRLDMVPWPPVITLRSPHPPRTSLWRGCLMVTGLLFLRLDRVLPAFSERALSLWPWFLLLALVLGVQLALILPSMGHNGTGLRSR